MRLVPLSSTFHSRRRIARAVSEVPLPRLPFLHRNSVADVQGLASIPITYLERRLGRLSEPVMAELKCALAFALDIE